MDHKDIISKLSVKQKIALLADLGCLSLPEYNQKGIPRASVNSIYELLKDSGEGLTPTVLARTWNPDAVEQLIKQKLKDEKGIGLVVTPSPKIKFDVYKSAMSEDPELSNAFSSAYLRAVSSSGGFGVVDGFSIEGKDLNRLDEDVNNRILSDYFIRPFECSVNEGDAQGVVVSVHPAGKAYGKVNTELFDKAKEDLFDRNVTLFCEERSAKDTFVAVKSGAISLSGSVSELEGAYENYLKLKASMEKGETAPFELEEAYESGTAINEDMIDAAVERVLDFAFLCSEKAKDKTDVNNSTAKSDYKETLLDALRQSTVLLKNEGNALPFKSTSRIAVIGELAVGADDCFVNALEKEFGDQFFGAAKGYSLSSERCDELVQEAVELVTGADAALVFLGVNSEENRRRTESKTLALPANQVALLDALKEQKRKIIGVLVGDLPTDMRFDKYLEALLVAPIGKEICAKALSDIVFGRYSPGGRLAESYYDDPEGDFERIKYYKRTGRNKVGPFFGYREYDSNGRKIRYPFGYGLSYSAFEYSGLKFKKGKLTLTVKNVGKVRASEVVQIYVGKNDSAFVRPKKELKSFVRVDMLPGEKKTVVLENFDLSIYDDRDGRRVTEHGEYVIYAGSSVQNIKLEERISIKGERVDPTEEKRSDYLQSESNIMSNKFTVDKSATGVKKFKIMAIIGGVLLALAAAAFAVAFIIKNLMIVGIVAGAVLLVAGAALLGSGIVKLNIAKKIDKIRAQQTEDRFSEAEGVSVDSVEELFVKEFDATENTQEEEEKVDDEVHLDNEVDMATVAAQMLTFFREKGIEVTSLESSSIVAALASSRLIFANSDYHGEALNRYFRVLSEYFGTPLFAEEITGKHSPDNGLLFVADKDGTEKNTNVMEAINHARDFRRDVHIVVLNKVKTAQLSDMMLQYVRYFNNPNRDCYVSVKNTGSEYKLPENMWFVVDLDKGETLDSIPSYLTEISTVLNVSYFEKKAAKELSDYHKIGYYEFSHLASLSRNKFEITEDVWKKVDGLEAYVSKHSNYRIGNKLALQIEKYYSVYNDCCNDNENTITNVFAAKLLPTMMSVLKNQLTEEDKTLFETMEQLFGEEIASACLERLKGMPSQNA